MDSQSKKQLKKNWDLTADAFEKLLLSFDEDQEKASVIYEDIRRRLIRQFRANQSLIAEEQTDEVFNRVARKISEEGFLLERETIYSYFHQVARYVLLESQRQSRRKILGLEDLATGEEPSYDSVEVFEKLQDRHRTELGLNTLKQCREYLNKQELTVLDEYNSALGKDKKQQHERLAQSLGKSQNALKISINRIRKKIIECAKKKLMMLLK